MTEKSNDARTPKKRSSSKRKKSGRGGARRNSGRPLFRPTIEQRQTVEEMRFCGDSEEVIACAIGVDASTLRKHFEHELLQGYAQRRKEVVSLMFKEARAGNASAIRRLEEIGRVANASIEKQERPADVPKVKAGKKEMQQAAAQAVSSIFSPPSAPRLAAVNGQTVA